MYKEIGIKDIRPSAENYRRSSDAVALEELTASVKSKGILQPILVRPLKKPRGKFEIVAGHRRHQAATAAGLEQMPCMVMELSDEEALEVQVVENSQREDPNPMDEAHGFKRLIEMGKHTPETLAEKIDHSTKYVLSRMRLLNLHEEAQEAVATGEVSLGHALLMTRLKNPADQKRLLEMVLEKGGLTVKEAASRLRNFSMDLSAAEFDIAGCAECMGRVRNQTDLFPELKGGEDECMDAACFYDRRLAHWGGWLEEKHKAGFITMMDGNAVPRGGRSEAAVKIGPARTNWMITMPPRYAEECEECKERHAFYLYEHSYGSGCMDIEHGELCMDPECLDRMSSADAGDGDIGEGGEDGERDEEMSTWGKERLARALIARSLRGRLARALGLRERTLQRVMLWAMFLGLEYASASDEMGFLEEFLPGLAEANDGEVDMYDRETAFRVLGKIPADRLDDAIRSLAMAYVHGDLPLTRMVIDEEGEALAAAVAVDEEYLKEFEGRDLRGLVAELWPEEDARPMVLRDLEGMGDADIRAMILAQGDALAGRLSAAVKGLLVPEEEAAADECDGCGEEREDCTCEDA